jgi:hydrogenase maturation protease
MSASATHPVRVLICGQADRGDDGVGEAAVARLPPSVLGVADVRHCGQLGIDDLLDIPPGEPCIIVDAALGPPPGGLVVLPLERVAARAGADAIAPRSSHQLPIDQVLRLVEVLRGEVPRGTFIGLGGLRFGPGRGLSQPVRLALPGLAAALGAEISRLAAASRC